MKYILIAVFAVMVNSCKKDNTKEVVVEWERPSCFDEGKGYGICTTDGGSKTIMLTSGSHYAVSILNCNMPHFFMKVKVYVNNKKNKDVLYEQTKVEHEINVQVP